MIDGMNAYSYVRNRPLRYSDPFGLCGEDQGGGQSPPRTPLDRMYGELARRSSPTILDEAIPEIAERSRAMGEHDTYIQLTATVLLALYAAPGSTTRLAAGNAINGFAAAHPATYQGILDFVTSLAPTVPTGLIQHVSTAVQTTEAYNRLANFVTWLVAQ